MKMDKSPLPFGNASSEQQQFLSLFLRSEKEVFRYVAALVPNIADAEDIVQQTALALWEKFDQYDPSKPFTPWACRFALNKARQWMERHRRWNALLEKGLAEELQTRRAELEPEINERLFHLKACLEGLPKDKRSLVEGYYYQRTAIGKLAQNAGKSEAALYKVLQRVRQSLQLCVESSSKLGGNV